MATEERQYDDGIELSLDEWLKLALDPTNSIIPRVIDYQFPTDKHAKEYIDTVHQRSEKEVKNLLRQFLIKTGSLGQDKSLLEYWSFKGKLVEYGETIEFARRLIRSKNTAWEGNTWVLDLLPSYPQMAIDAIDA